MLRPLCDTFSVDIDRIAAAPQPTTLHCCPLATLPMETCPKKRRTVLEKLGFGCRLDGIRDTIGDQKEVVRLPLSLTPLGPPSGCPRFPARKLILPGFYETSIKCERKV